MEAGETPAEAVVRELLEETGLTATSVRYLFRWESTTNRHDAFLIDADGEVVASEEVTSFVWWDKQEKLPLFPHVMAILQRLVGDE